MILKPFMLRRIKKDVENELSDKIEIMVYCPLTTRQRKLYASLKRQIRIEDLLQYAGAADNGNEALGDKSVTSNLMNLVMQFRKVCNHPELFERRDARSPLHMVPGDFVVPRLLGEDAGVSRASRDKLLSNTYAKRVFVVGEFKRRANNRCNDFSLNIFCAEHIHRSLFPDGDGAPQDSPSRCASTFSFVRFCQLETIDVDRTVHGGLIYVYVFEGFRYTWKLLNQ